MVTLSPPQNDGSVAWNLLRDVVSGHVIENLLNGEEYQVKVLAVTQNTELDLELDGDEAT